jgi:hypothetical protein
MDDIALDDFLDDAEYPVRVPVEDPMWIPDRIERAQMSGALEGDGVGSIFGRIAHAATQPFRSVANVAVRAAEVPFQVAERVAMTPFALAARAANALPGMPHGGGGGGAPAPAAAPAMPDDTQPMDPGDGGGDPSMSAGNWMHPSKQGGRHHHHHRHPGGFRGGALMGFGLPDWHPLNFLERHNPFSHPAGELLVSAVPGGVAAKEAHSIASKALKAGTLKPEHLKKAGSLARAARSGHKGSIKKIAQIKQRAGRGDPHAEVALDRLRLADGIQRGGTVEQSTTSLRHLRNIGLASLKA